MKRTPCSTTSELKLLKRVEIKQVREKSWHYLIEGGNMEPQITLDISDREELRAGTDGDQTGI